MRGLSSESYELPLNNTKVVKIYDITGAKDNMP